MAEILRIGVFFDGTGNNKKNDLAIGDGSQTNVAKLYDLYEGQDYEVLYEEGVGTEAYKEGGATLSQETINDIRNGIIKVGDLYDSSAMAAGSTAKDHVESMLAKIDTIEKGTHLFFRMKGDSYAKEGKDISAKLPTPYGKEIYRRVGQ